MNEESKNETRIEYENDAGKFVFVETLTTAIFWLIVFLATLL